MLNCSLFKAEILLKKHSWSKEALLQDWIDDPIKCCEKCGVLPPTSVLDNKNDNLNDLTSHYDATIPYHDDNNENFNSLSDQRVINYEHKESKHDIDVIMVRLQRKMSVFFKINLN